MWIRTIKGLKNPKKRIRVSLLILYDILVIGISEYTALLIPSGNDKETIS